MTRQYRRVSDAARHTFSAVTALPLLLVPVRVRASECAAPQHDLRRAPGEYLAAFPNTGTLWLTDEEAGDFRSSECVFRATSDSSAIPAVATLHPAAIPAASDNASEAGCGNPGTRLSLRVIQVAPSTPLQIGEEYAVACDGDQVLYPRITAASPAGPEHIDVSVRDLRRIEACGDAQYLRLDLDPVPESFFASGGLILVEYDEGAVDIIRGVEQHGTFVSAYVDLPLASQQTLTLRVVDALGAEFDNLVVDVSGMGRNPDEGCTLGSVRQSWLTLFLSLLWGRRRRSSRLATPLGPSGSPPPAHRPSARAR